MNRVKRGLHMYESDVELSSFVKFAMFFNKEPDA